MSLTELTEQDFYYIPEFIISQKQYRNISFVAKLLYGSMVKKFQRTGQMEMDMKGFEELASDDNIQELIKVRWIAEADNGLYRIRRPEELAV